MKSPSTLLPPCLWLPLLALPLMLNVRWLHLIEPNEAPKWLIMIGVGLVLVLCGTLGHYGARGKASPTPAGWPLSPLTWLLGLFYLGIAAGVLHAVNPGEGMNRLSFWATAGLVAWSVSRSVHQPGYLPALRWSLAVAAAVLAAAFWYDLLLEYQTPGYNPFVLFSRIGHFNFTADVLVNLIPLLTWALWTADRWLLRGLIGFGLASSAFMLVASGSIGGMGGIVAGGLVALGWGLGSRLLRPDRERAQAPRSFARRAGVWLALAVVLVLSAQALFPYLPKTYQDQILTRAEWWQAPKANALAEAHNPPPLASFWLSILPYLGARTPMWASTAGMIADRPWTGWGTGSFTAEYPAYSQRYDLFHDPETLGVSLKTNPHNLFLQLAADNGLPVALLFYGLYGWLLVRVMRQAWRTPTAFWLCGVWALWAAGLDAQVNHVFLNPASLFVAALALGLWYGALPRPGTPPIRKACRLSGSPLLSSLAITAALVLASYPITWAISEAYVATAVRADINHDPVSNRQQLVTWVTARRWSPTNVQALYGLANLTYQNKHYASAESYLKGFLKLAPNHTAGLNMLANIQVNTDRMVEAEKTLERALAIEPDAQALKDNLQTLREHLKTPPSPAPSTTTPDFGE